MSRLFASVGQSIGASASASVLPMNIQDWFSLGLTGLIYLQSKELSRVFSNTTVQKHQFFGAQPSSIIIHFKITSFGQFWGLKDSCSFQLNCPWGTDWYLIGEKVDGDTVMKEGITQGFLLIFNCFVYIKFGASLVAQSVKNFLQCRRPRFNSRVGKIPWRRKWQPTPVFLP